MRPPSAGPIARAALNCAEFNVTAFSRSSLGTSSETNACHDGMLSAEITPVANTTATSAPGLRTPASHMTQRPSAQKASAVCVVISTLRRSNRSAIAPDHGPMSTPGMNWQKPASPTHAALSVVL